MDCLGVLSIKNFFYDYDYEHNLSLAKQVNIYKCKNVTILQKVTITVIMFRKKLLVIMFTK